MQIYINNLLAVLKQGTSFDYICENRLFSGSDGYTLTITFPLRNCPENQRIFGHVNRKDVLAQKLIFDCEIRDRTFSKFGCITIVEITKSEVKTQFLDGRSEQNFDKSFDKIYINELDLGSPASTSVGITPANAWKGLQFGENAVALPWVNDASGNIQNCAEYVPEVKDEQGNLVSKSYFKWHSGTYGLSWMPYLLYITKQICEAVGYSHDFSAWEAKEEYKFLLICNALPYSWDISGYAAALPHWSVEEYFSKLELLLGCEFDIDHRGKTISFAFSQDLVRSKRPVALDNVVEDHSTEVKVENDRCNYVEAVNLAYKDCSHQMWKYYSCDWFVKGWQNNAKHYDTLTQLLSENKWLASWNGNNMRDSNMNRLLYAADVDTYFIIRTVSRVQDGYMGIGKKLKRWIYKCVLQPVNLLGPKIVDDSDDAQQNEIEFVPACIDYTDDTFGFALFLSFGGYDEGSTSYSSLRDGPEPLSDEWFEQRNNYFAQTLPTQSLAVGESTKKSEYYDRVYIGWWDGAMSAGATTPPHPHVENIVINDDWSNYFQPHFSLRLNDREIVSRHFAYKIDPKQKTNFKFLADTIPDVRALFFVNGKKYLCEKITATFTERGMSQLLKGVFYPVED